MPRKSLLYVESTLFTWVFPFYWKNYLLNFFIMFFVKVYRSIVHNFETIAHLITKVNLFSKCQHIMHQLSSKTVFKIQTTKPVVLDGKIIYLLKPYLDQNRKLNSSRFHKLLITDDMRCILLYAFQASAVLPLINKASVNCPVEIEIFHKIIVQEASNKLPEYFLI